MMRARTLSALIEQIAALLADVCQERRALHRERHAVFEIIIEGGHLPTLPNLADLFASKSVRSSLKN